MDHSDPRIDGRSLQFLVRASNDQLPTWQVAQRLAVRAAGRDRVLVSSAELAQLLRCAANEALLVALIAGEHARRSPSPARGMGV